MKIGAYVHGYPPHHNAGSEHMLHAILGEYTRLGNECRVHVNQKSLKEKYCFEDYALDGVRVSEDISVLDGCDIIITHHNCTPNAEMYCQEMNIPLVQIFHEEGMPTRLKKCDLAVYNTDWLMKKHPVKSPSIVIHPPIYGEKYETVPGKNITLVNLNQNKGAKLFYELAEAMPEHEFLGVKGAYHLQLPAPKLKNLRIMETQTDARNIYSETAILLMPSTRESYGMVAVEASFSGIPTIANPTAGLKEALGDSGVFPASLTVTDWKQAIETVKSNYESYSGIAGLVAKRQHPQDDVSRLIREMDDIINASREADYYTGTRTDKGELDMKNEMDVVYQCRDGDNEELRYSIRSVVKNLPHRRIVIVGGAPSWIQNCDVIRTPQTFSNRMVNAAVSLKEMISNDSISDPFVFFNDDFFIMRAISETENINRGTIQEHLDFQSKIYDGIYTGEIRKTLEVLRSLGFSNPLSFELHTPMVFRKELLARVMEIDDANGGDLHRRSIYGNLDGAPSIRRDDNKLLSPNHDRIIGDYFSTDDKTFPVAKPMLEYFFNEPSIYEKPIPAKKQSHPVSSVVTFDFEVDYLGIHYSRGSRVARELALEMKEAGVIKGTNL